MKTNSKQNHSQVKSARPFEGRKHAKVLNISGTVPSNSKEQSESFLACPKPPPDPLISNPKPPDDGNNSRDTITANLGEVAMEWETEERILAPKIYTSQNPSTSVVPTVYLHDDSDNVKKREAHGISKIQKIDASFDSLTHVEGNTDRAHWEPPFERTTHHQE